MQVPLYFKVCRRVEYYFEKTYKKVAFDSLKIYLLFMDTIIRFTLIIAPAGTHMPFSHSFLKRFSNNTVFPNMKRIVKAVFL